MWPLFRRPSFSIFIYAISTLLVSGSNFLIVPLLLGALGPVRFSTWALMEPMILLFIPLSGLGIHIGLLRGLTSKKRAASFVASVLPYHISFAALAGLAGIAVLLLVTESKELAILAGAIIFLDGTVLFFISYWRALSQPLNYMMVEGGRAFSVLSIVAISIWLGHGLITEVSDYLYIRIILALLAVLFALRVVRPQFSPDTTVTKRAIKFGLPIVLAGMAVSFMGNFDRYAVLWVDGPVAVSYYVVHVKVAQILGSALAPFFIWYAPIAIRKLDEGSSTNVFFARSFFGFITVNVALAVGLWLILPSIWPLLLPNVDLNLSLMAWLLLGMAVFSCGNPLSAGALREGKTHHSLLISVGAIGLGTALVLPLATAFGATGVAMAKFSGMIAYSLLFGLNTVRALGIRYPWVRIGLIVGFGVSLAILAQHIIDLNSLWTGPPAAFFFAFLVLAAGYFMDKTRALSSGYDRRSPAP